jgi:superfamily II DNA or RNA helicase
MLALLNSLPLGVNALVLIPDESILRQTLAEFSKLGMANLGYITSKDIFLNRITLAMPKTLSNRIVQNVLPATWLKSVGCLMVDEAHTFQNDTFAKIRKVLYPYSTFFFTGTAQDKSSAIVNKRIIADSGSVLYKVGFKELEALGRSSKTSIYIHRFRPDNLG